MNSLKILDVFIGNQCNLTCKQCDTRSDEIRTKKLDPDLEKTKLGILLASENFKIDNYSLLGGEPLLYLDKTKNLLEHIRSIAPSTNIFLPSNGTLINKFQSSVLDIIENYKITLSISNHFSAFADKTLSSQLSNNCMEIVKKLNLKQVPMFEISDLHFDLYNQSADPDWQEFLNRSGKATEDLGGNFAYTNNDRTIIILFKDQNEFKSHYYLQNGKPKPFASGDPQMSYENGCCSPFCSFLFETKLYKCGALGTLEKFLQLHKSKEDTAWKQYLQYNPLDLENCTAEQVTAFSGSKFQSVPQCDMCPSNNDFSVKKSYNNVIPIKNYTLP
jgi:organic radical activating enzyme